MIRWSASRIGRAFSALRHRNYRLMWIGTMVSNTGDWMDQVALNWLVVATNQRIVFVQHKGLLGGYAAKRTETFAWNELEQVSLGWGIFNKTLVVKSQAKQLSRAVVIPRGWMKGNFDAAKGATTQRCPPGPNCSISIAGPGTAACTCCRWCSATAIWALWDWAFASTSHCARSCPNCWWRWASR